MAVRISVEDIKEPEYKQREDDSPGSFVVFCRITEELVQIENREKCVRVRVSKFVFLSL